MGRAFRRDRRGESRIDGRECDSDDSTVGSRGQVHLIGLVLLVGLVAVASVGIVLLGSSALDAQEATVETERAEASLLAFAHTAETVSVTGERSSAVSIGPFDHGHLETREDGRMTVTHATDSGDEVLYDETLGTMAYVGGDTEVAYQGGGVWRHDGDGTVSLSSPTVDYRDGTLSLPVVRVSGEGSGQSIDGTVTRSESPTSVDLATGEGRAHAIGDLRIEIESTYCDGWERELESTVPGSVVESCSTGASERVGFELATPPRIAAIGSAVVAPEIEINQSAHHQLIDGDVRTESIDEDDEDRIDGTVHEAGYDVGSIDPVVETMVDRCRADGFEDAPDEITDPGRHCVETIDDDLTIDTSAGDVDLVVRDSIGDPDYADDLRVAGENDLTIYLDGDLEARGNATIGTAADPGQTRLLVSSAGTVTTATGTPDLAALVYAPASTVRLQGNPTVAGSVVADRVEIPNNNPGVVSYDDRIAAIDLVPGPEPHLHHLDATAYEVSIED